MAVAGNSSVSPLSFKGKTIFFPIIMDFPKQES